MRTAPATFAYIRIRELKRALERARPFVAAYGQSKPIGARLIAADETQALDAALAGVQPQQQEGPT